MLAIELLERVLGVGCRSSFHFAAGESSLTIRTRRILPARGSLLGRSRRSAPGVALAPPRRNSRWKSGKHHIVRRVWTRSN